MKMASDEETAKPQEKIVYTCPSLKTFAGYTAVVVVLVAMVIPLEMKYGNLAWYKSLDISVPHDLPWLQYVLHKTGLKNENSNTKNENRKSQNTDESSDRIFTKDELKKYRGDSPVLYLAILGQVFDVSKGRQYYGENGGYSFFSGIDGSRAFVTGEFNDAGLIDDISGLDPSSYSGLKDWLDLYHKDYKFIGKVVGYFYDEIGNERPGVDVYRDGLKRGEEFKKNEAEDKKLYPGCNSRWTQSTGTYLWCDTNSGGIKRDWVGYPRRYFIPGQTNHRCACIREELFDDPRFKEYEGCAAKEHSCKLKGK